MRLFDIGRRLWERAQGVANRVVPQGGKAVVGTAALSPNGMPEANILALSVKVASDSTYESKIAGHVFAEYTAACRGSVQSLEGYVVTSHRRGTTTAALGILGNVEHAGDGIVSRAIGVGGGPVLSGSGTITEAIGYGCVGGNRKLGGATGSIGTYKGVWIGDLSTTGAVTAYAIDCDNSMRADYATGPDDTRLLVWDVSAARLKRVKRGPPNSGPGGSGRMLYIDD